MLGALAPTFPTPSPSRACPNGATVPGRRWCPARWCLVIWCLALLLEALVLIGLSHRPSILPDCGALFVPTIARGFPLMTRPTQWLDVAIVI